MLDELWRHFVHLAAGQSRLLLEDLRHLVLDLWHLLSVGVLRVVVVLLDGLHVVVELHLAAGQPGKLLARPGLVVLRVWVDLPDGVLRVLVLLLDGLHVVVELHLAARQPGELPASVSRRSGGATYELSDASPALL